jgi:ornithine cyclodeaminase
MKIRILSGADVRALLPMDVCIDLMAQAMIAVSAGRARVPLRSVMPAAPGGGR